MGTRQRPQNGDQHHQDGAGGDGVAQQRNGHVIGQFICHDARTNHGADKQAGAECFSRQTARQVDAAHASPPVSPIFFSRFVRLMRSILSSGRFTKAEMRLFICR
jgi:hypothetical protein